MQLTEFFSDQSTPTADQAAAPLKHKLFLFAALVSLWYQRARQRNALAELDDRLLRDVNITRSQVRAEIEKPFWQA